MPESKEPKRMSVSFSADYIEWLEYLCESYGGISMNDVLRKAIATEGYIRKELDAGGTIMIQKADGSIKEIVFR